jgi:hypothetical protein
MRIKIGEDITVTDEYGQPMYEAEVHSEMEIFIGGATQLQVTDEGKLLYEVGMGAGLHPPGGADRPPTPIPPFGDYKPPQESGGGGSGGVGIAAPPSGSEIPWPASGQVVYNVPMKALQTVKWTMKWADRHMDPNKFGFVRVVEEPGSAVMQRHLKISVNGILKYDTTPHNETGPSCGLCNAPHPGSPSEVQMALGDILGIEVTNGENTSGQPSNMLLDIATPDRY